MWGISPSRDSNPSSDSTPSKSFLCNFWLILIELGVLFKLFLKVFQLFKYNTSCRKRIFIYPWNFARRLFSMHYLNKYGGVMHEVKVCDGFHRQILIKGHCCHGGIGCNMGGAQIATRRVAALLTNSTSFLSSYQSRHCHRNFCLCQRLSSTTFLSSWSWSSLKISILLPLVSSGSICCSVGLLCFAAIASTFERFRRLFPCNTKLWNTEQAEHADLHQGHVHQGHQKDQDDQGYLAAWVRPGDHSISLGRGVRGGLGGAIVVSCNMWLLNFLLGFNSYLLIWTWYSLS